ncbi:hypothetical protein HID58_006438, partial [Brassica napus]
MFLKKTLLTNEEDDPIERLATSNHGTGYLMEIFMPISTIIIIVLWLNCGKTTRRCPLQHGQKSRHLNPTLWLPNGVNSSYFLTDQIYTLLCEPFQDVDWHREVWFSGGILKHKFLTWLVVLNLKVIIVFIGNISPRLPLLSKTSRSQSKEHDFQH